MCARRGRGIEPTCSGPSRLGGHSASGLHALGRHTLRGRGRNLDRVVATAARKGSGKTQKSPCCPTHGAGRSELQRLRKTRHPDEPPWAKGQNSPNKLWQHLAVLKEAALVRTSAYLFSGLPLAMARPALRRALPKAAGSPGHLNKWELPVSLRPSAGLLHSADMPNQHLR